MTQNKKYDKYRNINMGDSENYNELINRDYVQGNVYNNCNINISQETNQQRLAKASKKEYSCSTFESTLTIDSSKNWVLIKGNFFNSIKVHTDTNGAITVRIKSESAEDDAAIRSLRPNYYGQSDIIAFAYRNDGFFVRIKGIEEEFEGDMCIWSLTLKPEDIQYGGDSMECSYNAVDRSYSPTDIAELRGRRILLNNRPKPNQQNSNYHLSEEAFLEVLISKPYGKDINVDSCIFFKMYPQLKDQPQQFLELSRLAAIFYLKAGDVVEQVLELSLELIGTDKVHVKFRGQRRKVYLNAEPAIIEIEGDCILV